MSLITDGLLIAAALFAGTYCLVLGRRVRALRDLDSGLGGAITRMTRALEDARRALEEAKATSRDGNRELKELIVRAEAASGQLRILLSATRDLPAAEAPAPRPRGEADRSEAKPPEPDRRPAAPVARREPLPLSAPQAPAPALDLLDRELRRGIVRPAPTGSPLRPRAPAVPDREDERSALADLAGAAKI